MTKAGIRTLYKQKRNDLSAAAKERLEDLMLIQFQSLHINIPDMVMTYSPIKALNEYNPVLIEEYCFFKNPTATLIYPVADFKSNSLKPFAVKEDTFFEINEFEIEEPIDGEEILPTTIELMIVPLLSFDEKGNRVGYGKGFYDKLIQECSSTLLKIGFSFFNPEIIDDVNNLDKKLDFCITPECIYEF
jgi:5-formyltetrahydrofolate cyclo-ligase